MTHPNKPRPHKRPRARPATRAALGSGPVDEWPTRADGRAGSPRLSIESAGEANVGSIQSLSPAEPVSGVLGFVESADDQDGDSHLPPCLEEN
jgi:hypothetical protein